MNRGPAVTDRDWFDYITAEVRVTCRRKGWQDQIRRKFSAREKPVSNSNVDDYEWKLIPNSKDPSDPVGPAESDEGTYFALGFAGAGTCVLQHDTNHYGDLGDHFFTRTYTEIDLNAFIREERKTPPPGVLERFLTELTTRFQANRFSIT